MKTGYVALADLRRQPDQLNWKPPYFEGWKALLNHAGIIAPIIVNSRNGHIITPPGMLETLQSMCAAGASPPRGVRVEQGSWQIPVNAIDCLPELQQIVTIALCGGVDLTLTPGLRDESLIEVLMAAAERNPAYTQAAGITPDEFVLVLESIIQGNDPPDKQPLDNVMPHALGIPTLDLSMQATEFTSPLTKWGTKKRGAATSGSIHFYTDDYKFSGLIKQPDLLAATGCSAAVEANFSIMGDVASAVAAFYIYQKRFMARRWQELGVRIWVDMNVDRHWFNLNMIGVPSGWAAYANRAYTRDLAHLHDAYAAARARRGAGDLHYLVYGGGKRVSTLCEREGWHWLPEDSDRVRGKALNGA